jgi:predicted HicB family RNase H-like nuclease
MPKQNKRKKAGRPRMPKGRAKVKTLRIRVTPDELCAIELTALAEKKSLSDWIRGTLRAAIE